MQELIKVTKNDQDEQVVSGRELHEFLEIKTPYTQWFERMEEYGFVENIDFILVSQKCETNNPKNPTTEIKDHVMSISMAKEISMIQRNEKGKQARLYFIACEKKLKESENYVIDINRQLLMIERAIEKLDRKELTAAAVRIIVSGRKYLINAKNKMDEQKEKTLKTENKDIMHRICKFLLERDDLVDKGNKSLSPSKVFSILCDSIDGFEKEFKTSSSFAQRLMKSGELGFSTNKSNGNRRWLFTKKGIEETLNPLT